MPLPIRDGNQSLTTLSTLIVNSAHVPAHTVVSLGSQAITDIAQAVSGVELGPNTLNALESITVTLGQVTITGGLTDTQLRASPVTIGGSVTSTIIGTPSVTFSSVQISNFPSSQAVTFGTAVITGSTSIVGTPSVTFGVISGTVTANLPSVPTHGVTIANSSVTVNGTFWQATQPVSLASLPSLAAGTAQIGSVTATISGTPSVTFSNPTITGSVSVLNFPSTQTIAGSVTIGASSITFNSNIAKRPDGSWQPLSVEAGSNYVNARVYQNDFFPFLATVTVGNSVTISSIPNISGTITIGNSVSISNFPSTQTVAGTVTANVVGQHQTDENQRPIPVDSWQTARADTTVDLIVPVQITNDSGTLNASNPLPISGTVTANGFDFNNTSYDPIPLAPFDEATSGGKAVVAKIVDDNGSGINLSVGVPISGTVTANGGNFLNADNALITRDSASNIVLVGGLNYSATPTQSAIDAIRTDGNGAVVVYSSQTNWTDTNAGNQTRSASQQTPFPVQILGGSVTIGSIPAISGTVTARLQDGSGNNLTSTSIGGVQRLNVSLASAATPGGSLPSFVNVYGGSDSGTVRAVAVDSGGRSVVTVSNFPATQPVSIASVTIGNSITIGSFSTSVTARLINPAGTAVTYAEIGTAGNPSIDVLSIQGVTSGTAVPVSISSVTIGAVPNGALTTRFGSVTTANTAQISSAVTNASRKYLLVQNVTTSSNVITIGIGFTPTTTQGIQLSAGGGITFESSYIPTGAVYILSSVTASPFTILEA